MLFLHDAGNSAAEARCRSVTLGENASLAVNQSNSYHPAVLKLQAQRDADPFERIRVRIEFDRTFNSMKARNRKARPFDDALEPAEPIPHLAEHRSIQRQFSDTGTFFDKLHLFVFEFLIASWR